MKTPIVIDASVLIALVDNLDKWHARADALHTALLTRETRAVYFDCVINEAMSVIGRRMEEQRRAHQYARALDGILAIASVSNITWVAGETQRLFDRSVEMCRETSGVLNFHDALIALMCQELGVEFIVSFDQDLDRVAWLKRIDTVAQVESFLMASSAGRTEPDRK